MRYLCAAIFLLMLFPRDAVADRIHLPCDPDLSIGLGTGTFDGRTTGIEFERKQPTVLRGELKLTPDQCELVDTERGKRLRLKRRWFGRVNFYLSVNPETSDLAYENAPGILKDAMGNTVYQTVGNCEPGTEGCEYALDENGQMIPRTKNGLSRADLHTGLDWSGGAGVRVSIYDGYRFHLELFAEIAGSPFFNPAYIDGLTAHVLETDLDVTRLAREHVDVKYRWWMYHAGLTIGVPFRLNYLGRKLLVPYVVLGYSGFQADIRAKVDADLRDDLEAIGADVAIIEEPRTIRKRSPTISLGARYDPSKRVSLETTAMFGYTGKTTVYWFTGSVIFRFDVF